MINSLKKIFVCYCLLFVLVFSIIQLTPSKEIYLKKTTKKLSIDTDTYKRNYGINNIIALVFYGRKPQASILLRYLVKSLKINGGVLDKVIFAVRTKNQVDLAYLDEILNRTSSHFSRVDYPADSSFINFYSNLNDDDLIFKIDDDIVFISNETFEKMIQEYLKNDLLFLSANVVNHPLLSYVHARSRAILPFIEISDSKWIKAENKSEIDDTEAYGTKYDTHSKWWDNPKCGAIAHESFLYHIYHGDIKKYDFGVWDFHSSEYTRWSINFVLMRGKYVNKMHQTINMPIGDEIAISTELPKRYKKHCYALGSAIVSHFSYFTQKSYLMKTDILQKYDALSVQYLK